MNDGAPAMTTGTDELAVRTLLRQLAVGLALLLAAAAGLAIVAREPLEAAAHTFVEAFGLLGVFFGVLITDTFLLTHEPILFVAYAGGLGFWRVFAAASLASVSAGALGWSLGGVLGRAAWVQRMFERYRITAFLARYGLWAVAVAALTPFPFSVATWAAGAAKIPLRIVMMGSLFRVPKVLFYFGVIIVGWDVIGG